MDSHKQLETPAVDPGSLTRAPGGEAQSSARLGILWNGAAITFLLCTAIMVLAVPVFPSQDGPVHLYYVDLVRSLLTHSGPYTQHFEIKALLTPYLLEYYSLLVFEMAFSSEVSEKLLVCCYILAFGLGFRYLVQSVAEWRNPWTLAGIPFCMNMLVYMGFLNYCIGVALALFLSGFWIRCQGRFRLGRITAVLACFILMLLTHPVPVAVFLLFAGLHFVADLVRADAAGSGLCPLSLRARWRPLAMITFMAGTATVWVGMFVNYSQLGSSMVSPVAELGWIRAVTTKLELRDVAPFTSPSYRIGLVFLVAATGLSLLVSVWKHRGHACSVAAAMIATSAICFALSCIAPGSINGSFLFPQRFGIFWVMFLIAAAAALRPPRLWRLVVGLIAVCATSAVLLLQWANVSRIALEMRPVLDAPPVKAGSVGLIIANKPSPRGDLAFDPFLWGGVHYFRRSGAILANAPWMDSPIIMIRPADPDRWSYSEPYLAGQALLSALSEKGAAPEISLVVRDGTFGALDEAVLSGIGWSPLARSGGFFGIYARHP
jgi:hypothetical protein